MLRTAGMLAAAGCAAWSAHLLGVPAWLAAAGTASAAMAARARIHRRPGVRVGGLRASPDPAAWSLLSESGWRGARLVECRRGLFWLSLSLCPDDTRTLPRRLCVTVWRPTLSPSAWRRLCIVSGRAMAERAPMRSA
ncbi:integral membrane protein [Bordetella ansorpii]|uniref:Integral membrane protein n=1 Tax=Bordetella ansorpii TaxID=288768 RepID=A0A157ST57_9BORD|nr:hypothetical protein [Bordetella ansorpii]SAI73607.1 integral membrane protein [Bordetella ansorpii]